MTLREIELKLEKASIKPKDFKTMTDYCIKLEGGGAIHIGWKGNIFVMASEERTEELEQILGIKGNWYKGKDKSKTKRGKR